MRCPYCDFQSTRRELHAHLTDTHGDTLQWKEDAAGYTYCVVTCPLCRARYEQIVRKSLKDPGFVEAYARQIRLVVFDILLYHLQAEHGWKP